MTTELTKAAQQACHCQTCRPITMEDMRMVLCPTCGNKRCPHANDHRNACTGSNEPGQPGSAYPASALTTSQPAQAGEQWTETAAALNYYARNGQWPTQPAAQATPETVKFSHAGHFYNLVAHALMDVKRPDACAHRLRLILDELAVLMGQPATPTQQAAGEPAEWQARVNGINDEKAWTRVLPTATEPTARQHVEYLRGLRRADGQPAYEFRALYTHPAPGVPEGWRDAKNDPPPVGVDVLVAVEFDGPGDWRIKVGGRNPQERTGWCVFGASWVPQVWMPLDAHRDALAAAQAKGGEHG